MCVGFGCMLWLMGSEKRRLVIPAGLAYGNRGAGDLIPAGRCERDDSRKGATLVFDVELIGIRGKGKYANKFLVSTNTLLLHNQYTCLRDLDLGQQVDDLVHHGGSGEVLFRRRQLRQNVHHPRWRIGSSGDHGDIRLRDLHRLALRAGLQILFDESPPPHQRLILLGGGFKLAHKCPSTLPPGSGTAAAAASSRSASLAPHSTTQIGPLPAIQPFPRFYAT